MTSADDWVLRAVTSEPEVAALFADDPAGTMQDGLKLLVQVVDDVQTSRGVHGACDGISFLEDGVVTYRATPYSQRDQFTLGHETGHFLLDRLPGFYDWLVNQPHEDELLESMCDRIAARLLLPDSKVTSVVGAGPLRAVHVDELVQSSRASRPACAIALAQRLNVVGAVVLIDQASRVVSHASVRSDPDRGWPTVFPWRSQPCPAAHPLAVMKPGASWRGKSWWSTQWEQRADYYIDAVSDGRTIVAVFADTDLWSSERLHLDQSREYDTRPWLTFWCCGREQSFQGYPCGTCGRGYCRTCRECECDRRSKSSTVCIGCNLEMPRHRLQAGRCEECR